ncbi:MAG: HAMP domain-containing protein, partial [Deltaproteobacteria bacterium]|nr:HAMP domain-containing protein [Candidatus Anaeroferrophillus wilburensis]
MNAIKKLTPRTLLAQILVGFTSSILLFSLAFLFTHRYFNMRFVQDLLYQSGKIQASYLARASAIGLYTENKLLLREPLAAVLEHRDVAGIAIYDRTGNLWFKKIKPRTNFIEISPVDIMNYGVLLGSGKKLLPVVHQENLSFFSPIFISHLEDLTGDPGFSHKQNLGLARVLITRDSIQSQFQKIRFIDTVCFLMAVALSLLMGLWISRRLVAPVKALTEGAKRAATGNLQVPVASYATGELAELTWSFNSMLEARQKYELLLARELNDNVELTDLSSQLIAHPDNLESIANLILEKAKKLTRSEHGYYGGPQKLDNVLSSESPV